MIFCTKCLVDKPEDHFLPKKDGSGYHYWCKECRSANRKKNYYANLEKERAQSLAWNKANPEKTRESVRKWFRENPDKHLAHVNKWREENPEKAKNNDRRKTMRYRARKKAAFVETVDPMVLFERDKGICGICQKEIVMTFEVDHVVPLAVGGVHSYDNCQVAHPSCNRRKGANQFCKWE